MKRVLFALITTMVLAATARASYLLPEDYDESKTSRISQVHFRFGAEGVHPNFPFDTTGLSGIEQTHRWTEGEKKEASFTIPHVYGPNRGRVTSVTFENIGVLRPQIIVVCLNNLLVKAVRFTEPNLRESITIKFPLNLTGSAVVTLKMPGACCPGNGDPRILGAALSTLLLTFDDSLGVSAATAPSISSVDREPDTYTDSNLTSGPLSEMTTVFKEIEADHQSYLSWLQLRHFNTLDSIVIGSKPVPLEALRHYYDKSNGLSSILDDSNIVRRYLHISWLIESDGSGQALSYYDRNPHYIAFITKNENLIKQETKTRKDRLEELAENKVGFARWLQTKHYNSLGSIQLNLEYLESLRKTTLPFGGIVQLNDEQILALYFDIAATIQQYDVAFAIKKYIHDRACCVFITTYKDHIRQETKARLAGLAVLAQGSIPTVMNKNYVIERFLLKYPQYCFMEAESIYTKFIEL